MSCDQTDILPEVKGIGPIAVLSTGTRTLLDGDWFRDFFDRSKGDVLSQKFAKRILLQSNGADIKISPEASTLLRSWGNRWVDRLPATITVPQGPYIYKKNALWQVLRLYNDDQRTFVIPVRPTIEDGEYGTYILNSCYAAKTFYSNILSLFNDRQKPFADYRIAVKDAFDIKGVKTSMYNKAFLALYPPATSTAPSILHVIEGGASLVGKTKLSSFLSREEALGSVDSPAPWNPRADGRQTTGGSGSGSAAAIAAYEWIDIGIGTDTNGSIREQAQCNGVFGLRPSQGIFAQAGIFTVFKHFDVPGLFARDINKLGAFASKWYGNRLPGGSSEHLPPKIVVLLDWLPEKETPQTKLVSCFLRDFESCWNIKAELIDVRALWAQDPPKEAHGQGMHEYLENVGRDTFLYANYHSGIAFRDQYFKVSGRKSFASKFVQWRWDIGSKISIEEHEEAMRRMSVYKEWFLNTVMEVGKRNSFVVMQSEDVVPRYRDDPPPGYSIQPAWHQWWLSPILGAPEIVIPAGSIPYNSRISGLEEHLPVTAQILSQPGKPWPSK
ncbi:MAG: hypothetical protein Q9170_004188 [Blastenia crenularia]